MTTFHAPDSRRAIPSGRAKQAWARTVRLLLDVMAQKAKGARQLLQTPQEFLRHDGFHSGEITPCPAMRETGDVLDGVCPLVDLRRLRSDVKRRGAPGGEPTT